ncbi:MAG: hypothetical protein CM15mP128_4230 [Methanobacteriota archaeon]|nr:MAG: hypothetical protein CM15mP128_4230 [Euryarchaeota archaeon]
MGRGTAPSDHEITPLVWALDQSTVNAVLRVLPPKFYGHGWQERVGESLTAWELGDPPLGMLETADNRPST